MIYHVLPEAEHFSEFRGGAISRWAAKVLEEEPETNIICSSADSTWNFASGRIHLAQNLRRYLSFRARRFYPPQVSGPILRGLFGRNLPPFHKGDLIWVHGVPALAEALAPAARQVGAHLVFHLHDSAFATHNASVLRRLMRHADRIVFCSKFIEDQARARFPELARAAVLHNGADETMFFPADTIREPNAAPVVLFASRLVPQKGAHVLLAAMHLLAQRGVALRARLFGASFFGGSPVTRYMRSLKQQAPANVEFCGYASGHELAAEFRKADLFCLPATYPDPFPLAILEAMACGLPVIASRTGGIPEALRMGGGVMVPANDPASLADALEQVAGSMALRSKLSQEAVVAFTQCFRWTAVRKAYRGIVADILQSVPSGVA